LVTVRLSFTRDPNEPLRSRQVWSSLDLHGVRVQSDLDSVERGTAAQLGNAEYLADRMSTYHAPSSTALPNSNFPERAVRSSFAEFASFADIQQTHDTSGRRRGGLI
jgi:hypothetical protein